MVSGHLQVKKGFYYVVLSYYNNNGKRRVKYFSTGLPEKGNKRKAEAELVQIRSEGAEICNENRPCYAECGNESRPPEKERLSACIP